MGRLTADPICRTTPAGQQVATFSIATNRSWTDKSGVKKEDVQFHNIVMWGRQADIAQRFLMKGGVVFVEGRLQTRKWDDKTGQKRQTTEVIAEAMQLGPRPQSSNASASATWGTREKAPQGDKAQSGFAPRESEIPSIELDAPEPVAPEVPAEGGEINPNDLNF